MLMSRRSTQSINFHDERCSIRGYGKSSAQLIHLTDCVQLLYCICWAERITDFVSLPIHCHVNAIDSFTYDRLSVRMCLCWESVLLWNILKSLILCSIFQVFSRTKIPQAGRRIGSRTDKLWATNSSPSNCKQYTRYFHSCLQMLLVP